MKAQFKFVFTDAMHTRGFVFLTIFLMNLTFIVLGSAEILPTAALITALSLGGVAISVVFVINVIGDVRIFLKMFAAPTAYLQALTPISRGRMMLSNLIAITLIDTVTLTVVIVSEVWLAFIFTDMLAGKGLISFIWEVVSADINIAFYIIVGALLILVGYFWLLMFITFCIAVNRSLLSGKRGSGILTTALVFGGLYIFTLLQLVLAPFGAVYSNSFGFIQIILPSSAMPIYALFLLLVSSGLYMLTSKLMERKLNI
ncbi:MAG: hypothetical protein FWH17_08490 [Oscillospiraceae bacterium]|nr:hypothetical protein [Oscillospiraceae bacterium]